MRICLSVKHVRRGRERSQGERIQAYDIPGAAHLAKEAQPKEMWLTITARRSSVRMIIWIKCVRYSRERKPPVMAGRQSWDLMRSKGDADGRKEREYRRKEGRTDENASFRSIGTGTGESSGIEAEISVHDTRKRTPIRRCLHSCNREFLVMRRQLQS